MPPDSIAVVEPNPTVIESHPPPKDVGKLGATPQKSSFGEKFREEFAKLGPPKGEESSTHAVQTPDEPVSKPTEAPTKEPEPVKKPTDAVETPSVKPESPLDVVLEKGTKEPEKVEEPTSLEEFDKITVPKSEHWSRARGVMKSQSEKIRELEGKLTAPKVQPEEVAVQTKRIEELQAELADRDTRLKAVGAEYSPDYQKLVGKYQTTAEKIKTRMQSYGADGDSLLTALSLPYSKARTDQIDAALADLDLGKQVKVQKLIDDLEGHEEEIAEFRKDLPARYEEMTAKQEQAAREQQANAIKQLETEFIKITEQIPESIVTMREVPDDVPGGTEWNKEITEARANALRILKPDGADFNESVAIALKGARYDSLEKRYLALHYDHVALKKQMKEYDTSGPDFKGGSKPTPKGSDKKPGAKYHEVFNAIKRGEMADV